MVWLIKIDLREDAKLGHYETKFIRKDIETVLLLVF